MSSVLVTLGIAIFITYYASGFRIRVKGWIDKGDVVRVRVFNWERLAGEISECRIVVRHTLAGHIIRRLALKPMSEGLIERVLDEPDRLDPGNHQNLAPRDKVRARLRAVPASPQATVPLKRP